MARRKRITTDEVSELLKGEPEVEEVQAPQNGVTFAKNIRLGETIYLNNGQTFTFPKDRSGRRQNKIHLTDQDLIEQIREIAEHFNIIEL